MTGCDSKFIRNQGSDHIPLAGPDGKNLIRFKLSASSDLSASLVTVTVVVSASPY